MGAVTTGPHVGAPRPSYDQYPATGGRGPGIRGWNWVGAGGRGETDPDGDGARRGLESDEWTLDNWSTSVFCRCVNASPVAWQQQATV